jgi:hypothetical protein
VPLARHAGVRSTLYHGPPGADFEGVPVLLDGPRPAMEQPAFFVRRLVSVLLARCVSGPPSLVAPFPAHGRFRAGTALPLEQG